MHVLLCEDNSFVVPLRVFMCHHTMQPRTKIQHSKNSGQTTLWSARVGQAMQSVTWFSVVSLSKNMVVPQHTKSFALPHFVPKFKILGTMLLGAPGGKGTTLQVP